VLQRPMLQALWVEVLPVLHVLKRWSVVSNSLGDEDSPLTASALPS